MKCASKITINQNSCLPKCSGLQISNFVKDSIEKNKDQNQNLDNAFKMQLDILKKLYEDRYKLALSASVTSWSRYYLHKNKEYIFQIPEFSKNTKIQDFIENLSEKYWNYKGSYNLESKGNYSYFLTSINS